MRRCTYDPEKWLPHRPHVRVTVLVQFDPIGSPSVRDLQVQVAVIPLTENDYPRQATKTSWFLNPNITFTFKSNSCEYSFVEVLLPCCLMKTRENGTDERPMVMGNNRTESTFEQIPVM